MDSVVSVLFYGWNPMQDAKFLSKNIGKLDFLENMVRKSLQLPFLSLFARYRQVLSTSSKPRNLEGVSTDLLGGFGSDNGVTDLSLLRGFGRENGGEQICHCEGIW